MPGPREIIKWAASPNWWQDHFDNDIVEFYLGDPRPLNLNEHFKETHP